MAEFARDSVRVALATGRREGSATLMEASVVHEGLGDVEPTALLLAVRDRYQVEARPGFDEDALEACWHVGSMLKAPLAQSCWVRLLREGAER